MRLWVGILIGCATIGCDAAFAQSQTTTICGRVVAVSCTNNQSDVRILLRERLSALTWAVQIPSSQRSVFDTGRLTSLDDVNVCVRTTMKPLGRNVMLPRLADLVINDDSAPARFQDNAAHSCDGDVEMPTPVREVKASMTGDAMRAKANGAVVLRAVVDVTGAVRDVRVAQALEPSQDAASREALEKWIFKPARRGGAPVPMRISVEMHFTVR